MVTSKQADEILAELSSTLNRDYPSREAALHAALRVVVRHLPQYTSVGVYLFDGGVLNRDAFAGTAPEPTLIPVGQGVVGRATAEGSDVLTDREAAVLLRDAASSHLLGVLYVTAALDDTDHVFLAAVAQRLVPLLRKAPE